MIKHPTYQIFLWANDRGAKVNELLKSLRGAGAVCENHETGDCVVNCPSELSWHEWWADLERRQYEDAKEAYDDDEAG